MHQTNPMARRDPVNFPLTLYFDRPYSPPFKKNLHPFKLAGMRVSAPLVLMLSSPFPFPSDPPEPWPEPSSATPPHSASGVPAADRSDARSRKLQNGCNRPMRLASRSSKAILTSYAPLERGRALVAEEAYLLGVDDFELGALQ